MADNNLETALKLKRVTSEFSNKELQVLASTIETLQLEEMQKQYLLSRLLSQIEYMENKASRCKKAHLNSRKVAILGGVIVTALVGLTAYVDNNNLQKSLGIAAFIASQAVTVSAALEQLHKNSELWMFYRRSAEYMKSQLWQLVELSGPYEGLQQDIAFRILVKQTEEIIPRDLDIFAARSSQEQGKADSLQEQKQNVSKPDAA